MSLFVIYFAVMNLIGFLLMGIDKQFAIHKKRRVPEKNLWIISILGGCLGAMFGMNLYRHKTKHIQFQFGLPMLVAIWVIALFWIHPISI